MLFRSLALRFTLEANDLRIVHEVSGVDLDETHDVPVEPNTHELSAKRAFADERGEHFAPTRESVLSPGQDHHERSGFTDARQPPARISEIEWRHVGVAGESFGPDAGLPGFRHGPSFIPLLLAPFVPFAEVIRHDLDSELSIREVGLEFHDRERRPRESEERGF